MLLCDGTEVKNDTIENLLQQQTGDLTILPNISQIHLNVAGRSRQNVKLAAQLFYVAKALKYIANKERDSSFIKLVKMHLMF